MNAAILIVSDDVLLSYTRTLLLRDWEAVTTTPRGTLTALLARPYDLLILCQSVPDDVSTTLAALATETHPTIKVLAIRRYG